MSQPYIVALMTDLLQLDPEHSVLEIGTGLGYQSAVLAAIARQVYSVEIIAPAWRLKLCTSKVSKSAMLKLPIRNT